MSTRKLVVWITFLAVFAMAARISLDTDTWWHLRAGQWIVEHRSILQVDPFSYTRAGQSWQYPGWLVEVPMYWIYRALGPGGLNLWTASMVTLAFAFVWHTLRGGPFLRAFVIVLAAAAAGVYWAARPYLVTFLLAAVYLWILEEYRWKPDSTVTRRLVWLPLLMIVWANSHGGFAVGFLLWGVYWLNDFALRAWNMITNRKSSFSFRSFLSPLLWVGLGMLLAVCVNPSGPVMLLYPFKTLGIGALQEYIQEWQSPNFHSLSVQPFAWLLLVTLAAVGVSRRRLAFTDFALAAGFAYMGLVAGRNIALFALVAPMVITRHVEPLFQGLSRRFGIRGSSPGPVRRRQAILNGFLLGVLILAVGAKVSLVYPASVNQDAFRKTLPVGAVEYIQQEKPPGRLFNSYNWGGYLLWALPGYPVFVDGRTDLYSDEVIGEWLQVVKGEPGWQGILDKWNVRLVLIEPDTPLASHLEEAGWNRLYLDDVAVVYGR